jgi:hypothetical protein
MSTISGQAQSLVTRGNPMKLIPTATLFASAVFMAACSPKAKPPIPSPNGLLTLHTSIESSRSDPTAYGCVIVEVRDKSSKVLYRENTYASDFHRWDIAWTSNDSFKLISSDSGTDTWTRQPDATWKKQ